MNNKVLFYTPILTNRLRYIVQLVFTDMLGLDIFLTQDLYLYKTSKLPKINYSSIQHHNNEFYIKSSDLLFENEIFKKNYLDLFDSWDVLSRIFFLVSRYEEYIADPSVLDAHRRFPSTESILKKNNLFRQPIVNQWVMDLKKNILNQYPSLDIKTSTYQFQATYDIDQAWAFKNKGLRRTIGGILRDLLRGRLVLAFRRLAFMFGMGKDPEYTFDYMESLHKKYNFKPIFFWLIGDYGTFDKNIDYQNRPFRNLIRHISKSYTIGIHPSYKSGEDINILKKEIQRLVDITKHPLSISRQHYLKIHLPDTYQRLISLGITADYSMGYADDLGFRAGIATSFMWYDLKNEQVTPLKIFPFSVMEVTLQQYLELRPNEAIEAVKPIIESTKAVGGSFTTLWHNTSLSDIEEWKGWREVYEKIIEEAVS